MKPRHRNWLVYMVQINLIVWNYHHQIKKRTFRRTEVFQATYSDCQVERPDRTKKRGLILIGFQIVPSEACLAGKAGIGSETSHRLNPQSRNPFDPQKQKRLLKSEKPSCALGRIRTLNPQSRNLVFYPVELRVHLSGFVTIIRNLFHIYFDTLIRKLVF